MSVEKWRPFFDIFHIIIRIPKYLYKNIALLIDFIFVLASLIVCFVLKNYKNE